MRERALASHINLTFTKGINEVLVDDCSGDDARFFLKFFFQRQQEEALLPKWEVKLNLHT